MQATTQETIDARRRLTKKWADRLNGRKYRDEMTKAEEAEAKADGVVIVFGYSDDNVELRGAIEEEVGAWEGAVIPITENGILEPCEHDNDEGCPHYKRELAKAKRIVAEWRNDDFPWDIRGEGFAFDKFDIMEDGEGFCHGIVYHPADV
jgi:hypothetical protein